MPIEIAVTMAGTAALLLAWLAGFTGAAPVTEGAGMPGGQPSGEKPAWLDTLMFKGKGGGGDGGADEMRRQEEERQRKIKESTEQINRIFDGFEGIEYQRVKPDFPARTGKGGQQKGAPDGYGPVFKKVDTGNSLYDQYRDDYLGHYQPQLQNQYEDAQEAVQFDLARRGATESAAGQQKLSDLLEAYNKQQTQIQSQATSAMNDYRGSVEQQRQALISQAQAGMAPTDAANLATNAYTSLQSQTPEYSALGDVFGQFADIYGTGLRAQGAGFSGYDVPGASNKSGLPGKSGTAKIRR